jgi:hypothetical protein
MALFCVIPGFFALFARWNFRSQVRALRGSNLPRQVESPLVFSKLIRNFLISSGGY